jgi:hypothetical protein
MKLEKAHTKGWHHPMKTAQKKTSKKTYIAGAPLPDKLPKKALEFFETAETPKRAFEIAEWVARIAARNNPNSNAKRAC